MAATALIQLTQGVNVGAAGEALVGTTGSQVDVANSSNTGVASWQIDLVYVPVGSALSTGTLAFNDNGNTPAANFTPDVKGSYRLVLTVWNAINRVGTYDTDIRVFAAPLTGHGFIKPPPQIWPMALPPVESGYSRAKPNEMNFDGQPDGWGGTLGDGLLDDVLEHIDKTGILTSTSPANVTKAAAAVGTSAETARADHKHDISTATAGAINAGASAAEGSATSLARSDHAHSVATATPATVGTANTEGAATSIARSDHVHDHGSQSTGTHHAVATNSLNGFMASTDKALFDTVVKAIKQPVRAATTANITLSAPQTIDGVSVIAGDRVLVKNQTTGSQNGIYVVAAGAWTRAIDFDADAEIAGGTRVSISEGSINGDRVAQLTTNDPIVIGTTALTFSMREADRIITATFGTQQDNYAPTDWDTADIARLGPTASTSISGFAAITSAGVYRKVLRNTSGSNTLTLLHQNASSTSANQIICPNSVNFEIPPRGGVELYYDTTSTDWRIVDSGVFMPNIISPTTISAQQDNYNPTGWDTATVVRVVLTNDQSISGFTAPTATTTAVRKLVTNTDSADSLYLLHNSTSSTAGNRILCPSNISYKVPPRSSVFIEYDSAVAFWRVLAAGDEDVPVVINPTAIAAQQDDYNPTGWDSANVVKISLTGDQNISGLTAPTANGNGQKLLVNTDSTDTVTLLHQSASSASANRIRCPGSVALRVPPQSSIWLFYDSGGSSWYPVTAGKALTPTTLSVGAIAAQQDDYNPTGWDQADILRFSLTGNQTITGFAAPTLAGIARKLLLNVDTTDTLTVANSSGSSTTVNRVLGIEGADITVPPLSAMFIDYDSSSSRWRALGRSAIRRVVTRIFNPGDTLYTPTAGMRYCLVIATGPGGGGGGAQTSGASSSVAIGSGGSAGGTAIKLFSAADIGASIVMSIGTGGGGGSTSGGNGSNGSAATTFSTASVLTGNAGAGGTGSGASNATAAQATALSAGATASNGDFNITGSDGRPAWAASSATCTFGSSGEGGASWWGSGANARVQAQVSLTTDLTQAGRNAFTNHYGAGGSGAINLTASGASGVAGGDGADGVVWVLEFIGD